MADEIWAVNDEAYVILEHLADNSEEKVLADYGMMLWGNMNYAYNEATMGYHDGNKSDFSGISHLSRGWSAPHLVGYMESHDEERLMFKNLAYGNSSGDYNIQDLETALERLELAGVFFFPIPGPKMIWQFGELGYDFSIDYECRVCNKPIRWDYNEGLRRRVYEIWGELAKLKTSEPAFRSDDFKLAVRTASKRIEINHPDMDVRIIGNFGVNASSQEASFSKTGTWYDFFSGDSITVSDVNQLIPLEAGEYRIYTTKRLKTPEITASVPDEKPSGNADFVAYPNPVRGPLYLEALSEESMVRIYDATGKLLGQYVMQAYQESVDLSSLEQGLYLLQRDSQNRGRQVIRILKD
jgi:hypothetical protein